MEWKTEENLVKLTNLYSKLNKLETINEEEEELLKKLLLIAYNWNELAEKFDEIDRNI